MTGGQMAPTTILGQTTTLHREEGKREGMGSDQSQRNARRCQGKRYIERTAVNSPANILKTKKAIAKAFRVQLEDMLFAVEVLSPCPTNWKMDTVESCKWIDEVMAVHFPLGVLKISPE